MELITFKTNISSEKALQRVAPLLNNAVGSANWQLDVRGAEKKLLYSHQKCISSNQSVLVIREYIPPSAILKRCVQF